MKFNFLEEFKAFALRGNVIDLAVGIIIGAAFSRVVSSLVSDVLTPPLGLLLGGVDFGQLTWVLKHAEGNQIAVEIKYGAFINTLIDFFIVAVATFSVMKTTNRLAEGLLSASQKKEIDPKS